MHYLFPILSRVAGVKMEPLNQAQIFKFASKGNLFDFQRMIKSFSQNKNKKEVGLGPSNIFRIIHAHDKQGMKAIHHAAKGGHTKFVQKLLCLGAGVNEKCFQGNTPLHYACMSSSLCCIVLLMASGANFKIANVLGERSFDVIPEKKQVGLGSLLREAGKNQEKIARKNLERKMKNEELLKELKNQKSNVKEDVPYPLKFLTHRVSVNNELELAKGPTIRFCKGEMLMTPISVKYVEDGLERDCLLTEANTLRYLRHPNILLCLGLIEDKPNSYQLLFEFPSHGFLHRALFGSKLVLTSEEILHIARDLANALTYLHTRGFFHCAVASFSVALSKSLSAKLCNFDHVQICKNASPISHLSAFYSYMSPEQLKGQPADKLNDVYGLGVVVYECITRMKLFDRNSLFTCHNERENVNMKLKAIPKHYEQELFILIESCLNKAKRRPAAEQVLEWLDALLSGRFMSLTPLTMTKEDLEPFEIEKIIDMQN